MYVKINLYIPKHVYKLLAIIIMYKYLYRFVKIKHFIKRHTIIVLLQSFYIFDIKIKTF